MVFIFGGSGDLNYRKLTPALYNLFLDKYLPEQFRDRAYMAFDRRDANKDGSISLEEFTAAMGRGGGGGRGGQ